MAYHGGGYADIEPLTFDWRPHFAQLDCSGADFNGYPERGPGHIAGGTEIRSQWSELAGCGYFIFRPMSVVAAERLRCIHDVLDGKLSLILKYPGTYHPRATIDGVHGSKEGWTSGPRGYPLRWAEIGGEIFHPLQCRYQGSFIRTMPRIRVGRWYR